MKWEPDDVVMLVIASIFPLIAICAIVVAIWGC
jgi:hypothetical protein